MRGNHWPPKSRDGLNSISYVLGVICLFPAAGLVPQRQLDPVPQTQLVIDQAQVVLYHVLGRAERIRNFSVFAAFGYALNDVMFSFAGNAEVRCVSCHNCLL